MRKIDSFSLEDFFKEYVPGLAYCMDWSVETYQSLQRYSHGLMEYFRFDYFRSHRKAQQAWCEAHLEEIRPALREMSLISTKNPNQIIEEWTSELDLIMDKCPAEESMRLDEEFWRSELARQDNDNAEIKPQVFDLGNLWRRS